MDRRPPTAGELRQDIILRALTRLPDGAGGWTETWTDVATVHARVEPMRAEERYLAQQLAPAMRYRIAIRWRDDVREEDMRVVHDGREYDIESVYDPTGLRRWLVLEVAEVQR